MQDAARAVQFLRHNAKDFGINADKMALSGGSAGGAVITMWIAFHDDLADPDADNPVLRQSTRVSCIAPLNGPTNLDPAWIHENLGGPDRPHPCMSRFYGVDDGDYHSPTVKKLAEAVSPIHLATADDPPAFLIYGGRLDNIPLPEDAPHGVRIHHPYFGKVLKDKLDKLGGRMPLPHRRAAPHTRRSANSLTNTCIKTPPGTVPIFVSAKMGLSPSPGTNCVHSSLLPVSTIAPPHPGSPIIEFIEPFRPNLHPPTKDPPMKPTAQSTRRDFLKRSALASTALALPAVWTDYTRGEDKNSQLSIASIGVGGSRGRHKRGAQIGHQAAKHGKMIACCDVDGTHLAEFAGRYDGIKKYKDYRKLFESENPDIVTIGTPDHWHTPIAAAALRAGCDVLLRKTADAHHR